MKVLAIESSCDDTSIAIVDTYKKIQYLQTINHQKFHKEFGGVVPEMAARQHLDIMDMVLKNLSKEWRIKKATELPLRRFGEPDDVANTALFLATDDSKIYIGQTLGPNSGDVML